ncbi:hypothetical protein Pmani_006136 [Petrolisthes manimaculis]|uniref:Uncharacterized protein n=1 Tax=Petrolisthes manimaculis TaxID=1843537 RepID=A0AAE1UM60_9EUCA|nr:hypothetical protein Pmani_006136 [Petrolisthes manimaculis]
MPNVLWKVQALDQGVSGSSQQDPHHHHHHHHQRQQQQQQQQEQPMHMEDEAAGGGGVSDKDMSLEGFIKSPSESDALLQSCSANH